MRIFQLLLTLLFCLCAGSNVRAQSQFAGTWVLDYQKTNTTRDFPVQLKNYGMVVTADNDILNVTSLIDGHVDIRNSTERNPSGTAIVSNSGGRTAQGVPVTGVSATTSVNSSGEKRAYGGTLAIFFTPTRITYKLNGEEIKTDLTEGNTTTRNVRIRAKLERSGNSAQFNTIRRMKTPGGEVEVYVRESWKLNGEGRWLELHRTVETPSARDEITMILRKEES